jgi:hypothetical protein
MKYKSGSNIGYVRGDAVGDAYGGMALFQMKTASLLLASVLVLVLAPLMVVIPQAYATGQYDDGYTTAKFDFLHHKSYNDSCHMDCTQYKLGYSEAWNTLNGWLGNR